jgi:4-hydroxy-2-oxoheptanedioate aldolase
MVGYWVVTDNPIASERLATLGFDYLGLDCQHGMLDFSACVHNLQAISAGGCASLVRVPANDPAWIGRALDGGAHGVIVPLVESAEEALAAVRATRYPPAGSRSYGPTRAVIRVGPEPEAADADVASIVMIETTKGVANARDIVGIVDLDAVYVGPRDLTLSLGAVTRHDADGPTSLESTLETLVNVANDAEKAIGIHCPDGQTAARRLAEGFDFVTVSNDLAHLSTAAGEHLRVARLERHDDERHGQATSRGS